MEILLTILILTLFSAPHAPVYSQEKKETTASETLKYEKMRKRHNKYGHAYLYTLKREERKNLFAYHAENRKVIDIEKSVKNEEARFQKWLRRVEMMTDAQRDSVLVGKKSRLNHERIVDVKLTVLDESTFHDKRIRDREREILELFKGYPVYVVTRKRKLPDGKITTASKKIVFQKTMDEIWVIAFLRAD